MHRRHVYASKLLYMISGKQCFFLIIWRTQKKKCSSGNRRLARPRLTRTARAERSTDNWTAEEEAESVRGWSSSSGRAGDDGGHSLRSSVRRESGKEKGKKTKTSPTDFMILIGSEGDSSIMDQWSLRSVLQGKEEKSPPHFPPHSESAAAATTMSQGRVTKRQKKTNKKNNDYK